MDPQAGDVKKIWDPENEDEVEDARRSFNDLKAKGYAAFEVGITGKKTTRQIREFDPDVGKMILAPVPRGG